MTVQTIDSNGGRCLRPLHDQPATEKPEGGSPNGAKPVIKSARIPWYSGSTKLSRLSWKPYPHTAAVMTSRPQGIRYHILSAFHRKRQSEFLRRLHRANPSTQSFFYPGLQPTERGPVTVHGYILRYTDAAAPGHVGIPKKGSLEPLYRSWLPHLWCWIAGKPLGCISRVGRMAKTAQNWQKQELIKSCGERNSFAFFPPHCPSV